MAAGSRDGPKVSSDQPDQSQKTRKAREGPKKYTKHEETNNFRTSKNRSRMREVGVS